MINEILLFSAVELALLYGLVLSRRIRKLENKLAELAQLDKTQLSGAQLQQVQLSKGQSTQAQLDQAHLSQTKLDEAHLAQAPLDQTELNEAPAAEVFLGTPDLVPSASQSVAPLVDRLVKTRGSFFSKILKALSRGRDDGTFTELEELLIQADVGVRTSEHLVARLRSTQASNLKEALHGIILETLSPCEAPELETGGRTPFIVLVVGVNGVGKTTTIGKLARKFTEQGKKVILGACDTFRAAASEQLGIWAERSGVKIVEGEGKPTTVAFQAVEAAKDGYDIVIIDTAGRLHTKTNLMNELVAVAEILARSGGPHETLLVLDATTGQNALEQAREFNQRVKLTGLIITKLDGTPKGGVVISIAEELKLPVRYIGVGEGIDDLRPFSAKEFTDALFEVAEVEDSSPRRRRRTNLAALPSESC